MSFALRLALIWLVGNTVAHAQAVPARTGHVTDQANLLAADRHEQLERKLAGFETRTGTEVAVLIVPRLPAGSIERFSRKVAAAWNVGDAGTGGVLLSVAKADRQMQIEVTSELEAVLSTATRKRIVAETIKPHFKRTDFFTGLDLGVDEILRAIAPEPVPAAVPTPTASAPQVAAARPAKVAPPRGSDSFENGKVLVLLAVATVFFSVLMPPFEFLQRLRWLLSLLAAGGWYWALQRYAALPSFWLPAASAAGGVLLHFALRVRDAATDEDEDDWWWRRYFSDRW